MAARLSAQLVPAVVVIATLLLAASTGHGAPAVPADSRQREPAPHVPASQHVRPDTTGRGWTAPAATMPDPGGRMMRVPVKRKEEVKRRAVDIGVGHRVKRGPDWMWEDQDGGKGGVGTVIEISPWRGEDDPFKFGVRVKWDRNGKINLYRWGVGDQFDLDVIGYSDKDAAKAMREKAPEDPPTFVLDKDALLEVFRSSDGSSWGYNKGWTTPDSDPCKDRWSGVTCNATTGRVIALDLSNNRVASRFPRGLEKLAKLQALTLAFNRIEGTIPAALGKLRELRWLDVHDNMLSGPLPPTLGALRKLEWLSAFNNRLDGTLPQQLSKCKRLTHVYLQANTLTGTIPEQWCKLAQLQHLDLDNNRGLTGGLPECLETLPSLSKLKYPRSVLPAKLYEKVKRIREAKAAEQRELEAMAQARRARAKAAAEREAEAAAAIRDQQAKAAGGGGKGPEAGGSRASTPRLPAGGTHGKQERLRTTGTAEL